MSANSVARKIMATRATFVRVPRRGISSQTSRLGLPQIVAHAYAAERGALINFSPSASSHKGAPACGWKKTIVSSSSSLPDDNESSYSYSMEDLSITQDELEKTTTVEELQLEVDMEQLESLASMRCTPLSLVDMYKYAVDFNNQEQRLRNAQFLHKELPIRIAQRAIDLLTLPHGLSDALPIRQIAHVYLLYLQKFQECPPPTTPEQEEKFTDMLQNMVLDRSSIPHAIAQGVDTWLEANDQREDLELERLQEMEDALYRFFTARVGLRFLTEHHILSSPSRTSGSLRKSQSPYAEDDQKFLGCIQTNCCPSREVRKVAEIVASQTMDLYGVCPEIQIMESKKKDSKFTYVAHHLHYMVGELLKNSCRATVRR
jgi:hypothetical protein